MTKKQKLLDSTPQSDFDWSLQQIVLQLNKTQLANTNRTLTLLDKILYKTQAKQLTFQDVKLAVHLANELEKTGDLPEDLYEWRITE